LATLSSPHQFVGYQKGDKHYNKWQVPSDLTSNCELDGLIPSIAQTKNMVVFISLLYLHNSFDYRTLRIGKNFDFCSNKKISKKNCIRFTYQINIY